MTHVALVFDDNHKARALFGQFDEFLAIIERDLHVEASARGAEMPDSLSAFWMAFVAIVPSGTGAEMWNPSSVIPKPRTSP